MLGMGRAFIPASYNTQNGAETDYRYSGRYLIETIVRIPV